MRKQILTTLTVLAIVVHSAYPGGSIKLQLMERAGLSGDQIEYGLSLPDEIQLSDDMEAILPGDILIISRSGRKAVVFNIPDTIYGQVFYDLNGYGKR